MGYKDAEKQKEYNTKYHIENKDKVKAKMCAPEVCPHCDRQIRHQWFLKHQMSNYCQTRRKLKARIQLEKDDVEYEFNVNLDETGADST